MRKAVQAAQPRQPMITPDPRSRRKRDAQPANQLPAFFLVAPLKRYSGYHPHDLPEIGILRIALAHDSSGSLYRAQECHKG
jgi:hypothetical protein